MSDKIQLRRDTAANWASVNPVLADGEIGYEKGTKQIKVGDGTTAWNSLQYGGIQGPSGPQGPPCEGVDIATLHAAMMSF